MMRALLVRDDALGWQELAAQLAGCSGITAVQQPLILPPPPSSL